MGLWTERLVGGEASRPDESPALVAVAGFRFARVIGCAGWRGLARWLLRAKSRQKRRTAAATQPAEWLEGRLGGERSGVSTAAQADVQSIVPIEAAAAPALLRGSACSRLRGCWPISSRSGCAGRCSTGLIRS